MKTIKQLLLFSCFSLLIACEEAPTISLVEILQNSNREWQIVAVKLNGRSIDATAYSGVRLRFSSTGITPTTYQLRGAGRAGIIDEGDKPNYFATANEGAWDVQLGGKLVFEPSSPTPSIVELSPIPKAGDSRITIRWTVPEELNKTIPSYEMTLATAN